MSAPRTCCLGLIVLASILTGCDDEPTTPRSSQVFQLAASHMISGTVLGPDGSSICHFIPEGSIVLLRAIDPVAGAFAGGANLQCPNSQFAIGLEPGTYMFRVGLPADPAIGFLPWRTVTGSLVIDGNLTHDIQVVPGAAVGGLATFEGSPIENVGFALVYEQAPGFGAALGGSGPDGTWKEFFGRSPVVLQPGVRYVWLGTDGGPPCDFLGARVLEAPPSSGFLFPGELSAINCTLVTAPSVEFSHHFTRLVVTPMPGELGGLSGALLGQFGEGWGVQFPVARGTAPAHGPITLSHLFAGGLMVGIAPDRVLTGFDFGYGECGLSCHDLGLDGRLNFATSRQFGTKALWRYSDAGSPDGVGLRVLQRSYDGRPPADYVLFRFSFTNTSLPTVSFYAGLFADWDIDDDFTDDVARTELDGRLMYMTNVGEVGTYVGSLLAGDYPVSGNHVLGPPATLADQYAQLSGAVSEPEHLDGNDWRYVHAVGPITLARDQSAEFWLAIVAGESRDELFTNAAAAAADIAHRRGQDEEPLVDASTLTVTRRPGSSGSARVVCKRCGAN